MEENLVKTECYICMEMCSDKSPCVCATHVHPTCLNKYLSISGHTHCTICVSRFELDHSRSRCRLRRTMRRGLVALGVLLLSVCLWYIVAVATSPR